MFCVLHPISPRSGELMCYIFLATRVLPIKRHYDEKQKFAGLRVEPKGQYLTKVGPGSDMLPLSN